MCLSYFIEKKVWIWENMFYVQATDGVKIAVYDYNSCGKQTVFLVHGWPLSHKIYEYQIPILIERGYRVAAIDLRGFGASDAPACNYGYDQMASDMHQVVKKLKLSAFTLVGFSMGGAIALRYMKNFGGYGVRKLILLSAAAPCWTRRPGFPGGHTKEYVNGLISDIRTDRAKFAVNFSEGLFASPQSREIREWFAKIALAASAVGTIGAAYALRDEDGRKDLSCVKVPTVIIHGAKDQVVSNELAQIQYESISSSSFFNLDNSGHGIMYDELEMFNKIFLRSL